MASLTPVFTFNAKGLSRMFKELEKMSGAGIRQVARTETARILDLCVERTKFAGPKALRRQDAHIVSKFNTFAPGHAGGKDERVAGVQFRSAADVSPHIAITKKARWVWANGHYRLVNVKGTRAKRSDPNLALFQMLNAQRQSALEAARAQVKAKIMAASGLAAKPWYQCAEDLGIADLMKSHPTARKAIGTNGRSYKNGRAHEVEGVGGFYIEIMVNSPVTLAKGRGAKILAGAIRTRVNAFTIELHKGVFDDLKTRVQRYPGLFVS